MKQEIKHIIGKWNDWKGFVFGDSLLPTVTTSFVNYVCQYTSKFFEKAFLITSKKRQPLFNKLSIFTFLILLSSCLTAQSQNQKYQYYSIEDGLSQNTVYSIAQDSLGFMWFGTQDGINRFDGNSFKVFKDVPSDTTSIKGNFVYNLFVDNNQDLWAGTNMGLNKYNYNKESFSPICEETFKVLCIKQDASGKIWFGTNYGLHHFHSNRLRRSTKYLKENTINVLKSKKEVRSLEIDNNTLWIGTNRGLYKLDLVSLILDNCILPIPHDTIINVILKGKNNTIYVGTERGNRYKFLEQENKFKLDRVRKAPITSMVEINNGVILIGTFLEGKNSNDKYNSNLSDRDVLSLFYDKNNILWIGTSVGGVNKYFINQFQFKNHQHVPNSPESLSDNFIRSICENPDGLLYIGTRYGELNFFNPHDNSFNVMHSINKAIYSIFEDSNKTLWFGSSSGNLYYVENNGTNRVSRPNLISLCNNPIRVIKPDINNPWLWIGTEDEGIFVYDYNSKTLVKKINKRNSALLCDDIYSILLDKYDDVLWVGTIGFGLYKLNLKSGIITMPVSNDILNKLEVLSIEQDPNKNEILWIGTSTGLIKFDKTLEKTVGVFQKGFPELGILGLLPDGIGNLWLIIRQGKLYKFNLKYEKIIGAFDSNDGLQKNEFVGNAYIESEATGRMYIGSTGGLIDFYPDSIKISTTIPPLYFTKLIIDGYELKVDDTIGNFKLEKSITNINQINLDYKSNRILELEFSTIDFIVPERIHYWSEIIKGEDTTFFNLGNNNSIMLSSLEWGKYKVNIWSGNSYVSDKDNRANQKSITIYIRSPWWVTPFAKIASIICVIFILSLIFIYLNRRKELKNKKKRIERLENKNDIINSINRKETTKEIAIELMNASLVLFGFDYVTVSMVNHLQNTISTEFTNTKDERLIDPNNWKDKSKFDLVDKDILCEVVRTKEAKKVLGHNLDPNILKTLNLSIFNKYKHENLNRVFIPIIHRSLTTDTNILSNKNIILGVVEAGFQNNDLKDIPEELIAEYSLFIQSCEQFFYWADKKAITKGIEKLVNDHYQKDDHREYLASLLGEMVKLIGADFGNISFVSFNEEKVKYGILAYTPTNSKIGRSVPAMLDMNSQPSGIYCQVIKDNKYFFCNDVEKYSNYIAITDKTNSELAVPIRYQDVVIGALNFESAKKDFFNEYKAKTIQDIADKLTPAFIKKKLNTALKNLVTPFDNVIDIPSIYNQTLRIIEHYFYAENVSIWNRTNDIDFEYEIVVASSNLNESINKNLSKFSCQYISQIEEPETFSIDNFINNHLKGNFKDFIKSSDWKSVIISPLVFNNSNYGFISIFSKRLLPKLFSENVTFLSEISRKLTVSVQYAKLVGSFYKISSLFTHNFKKIL